MSLQSALPTQITPRDSVTKSPTMVASSTENSVATDGSFDRVLHERMSSTTSEQSHKTDNSKKAVSKSAAEKTTDSADPAATNQTASGNNLPGVAATAKQDVAEKNDQEADSDTDDVADVGSITNNGLVIPDQVTTSAVPLEPPVATSAAAVIPVVSKENNQSAANSTTLQPSVATSTIPVTSEIVKSIPGQSISGQTPTNQSSIGQDQLSHQGLQTQIAVKSGINQQTTTVPTLADSEVSAPGTAIVDPSMVVTSDTKSVVLQLAAGMRAVDQASVAPPGVLLMPANHSRTQVSDGSIAAPVISGNGHTAAFTSLTPVSTPTVLTMPVGVQPGDPRWAQAFTDRVAWLVQGNVQTANIRLSPPTLGQLDIKISLQHDQASILIVSPHQTVRHVLEATLPQLRQQFDNMGFVDVQAQVADQQTGRRQQNDFHSRTTNAPEAIDAINGEPVHVSAVRESQGMLDLYI